MHFTRFSITDSAPRIPFFFFNLSLFGVGKWCIKAQRRLEWQMRGDTRVRTWPARSHSRFQRVLKPAFPSRFHCCRCPRTWLPKVVRNRLGIQRVTRIVYIFNKSCILHCPWYPNSTKSLIAPLELSQDLLFFDLYRTR